MQFEKFNWEQSYLGEAPDIGSFEGEKRMEGPPFKYLEPPMEDGYDEKPRIVRHEILGNEVILYFSFDLDEASMRTTSLKVFSGNESIKVREIMLDKHDRRKLTVTLSENIPEGLSVYFDALPVGINGKKATHWASAIPVRYPAE